MWLDLNGKYDSKYDYTGQTNGPFGKYLQVCRNVPQYTTPATLAKHELISVERQPCLV